MMLLINVCVIDVIAIEGMLGEDVLIELEQTINEDLKT